MEEVNESKAEKNVEVTAKEDVLLDNALILGTSVNATPPLVTVKESERSQKGDQKTPHEEESEEEVSARESETSAEAQITSHEFTAEEEVLLPDSITPSIKLFLFNIILPTIDIFLDTALVKKLFPNGFFGVSSPTTRLWSSTSLHARNGACFDIKLIG